MEKENFIRKVDWYREWFDENYELVYRHRTEAEAEDFVSHWPLDWEFLAGRRALDIGCGNGRFCRALARRGLHVTGLDLSADQLRSATSRDSGSISIGYVRADMRELPVNQGFSLIVSLFTSLGYFEDETENRHVILSAAELLLPGGIFVIDLPCRENAITEVRKNPLTVKTTGGVKIVERRSLTVDTARFEKEITLTSNGYNTHYRESARLFSANELAAMTRAASLTQIEPLWGDYAGGLMSDSKSRMVYFGRKDG